MLVHDDLFTYIVSLSPPSYRYASVLDVIYEYLKKMQEISDRKYEIVHNLYYRV